MVKEKIACLHNEGKRIGKYSLLILKIFLFSILINCFTSNEVRRLDDSFSTVLLVVDGTGAEQQIVSDEFNSTPSEIIVDANSESNTKTYNLGTGTFNVILKFNYKLTTLDHMFKSLSKIKEVDFSDFDFSIVESMYGMFFDCSDLQKVSFGETNEPKPTNVEILFKGCSNLKSVNLSNFDFSRAPSFNAMFLDCRELTDVKFGDMPSSSLVSMNQTFQNCAKLESIDLSTIIFSKVTTVENMFHNCGNLKYVNFGNYETTELIYMRQLFDGCSNLISLDLSNFNYAKVIDMDMAFKGCSNIEQIKLGEKGTSVLKQMSQLFEGCSKLTSIDLSHFTTTQVTTMASMFKDCSSIKYFDLDNFQTQAITNISSMFSGCTSFFYLNFYNLDIDDTKSWQDIFKNVPKNSVICINNPNVKNLILESDRISFCTNECANILHTKININNKVCVESCSKAGENIYDYNNVCYKNCPNGTLTIDSKCIDCENGKPLGFYLDPNDRVYKKCYETCKFCEEPGNETNHNCLECNSGYRFIPESENDKNCYQIFNSSQIEYNSLTNGVMYQCSNDNPLINKCIINNINNDDEVIKNDILQRYSFSNDKSFVFEGEDGSIYQVTSSKNELDLLKSNNISDDYNLSIIDFSECEALLKQEYNLNENDYLIFIKKEKLLSKAVERNIQYECFEPYNKTKLNISICSEVYINIYVPIELSDGTKKLAKQLKESGYNMFDRNDKFYNDICTPYTTTVESDIILSDRIDYIFNNEDTQCQGNCEFSDYFLESRFINCKCKVDNNDIIEDRIDKFETKTLYQIFYYVLKYSNYKIFKCYKLVFNNNSITKNWGSIIILILFTLYLMCLITYIIKGLTSLKSAVEILIKANGKENNNIRLFFPPKKDNHKKSFLKVQKRKSDAKRFSSFEHETKRNLELNLKKKDPTDSQKQLEKKGKRKGSKVELIRSNKRAKSISKYLHKSIDIISSKKFQNSQDSKIKINENQNRLKLKEKQPNKLDDFELNELSYEEAVIYDQRTFLKIYLALLKREHRILFTFFVCHDYNLVYVKLSRFIFLLTTDIAMNVFFFSDVTMHKQFLNYGKYNFVQQIPQIIYSTIVSQIIEVFICFLSLTDKHIYHVKNFELNGKNKKLILEEFKCIKIKLIFYFIFTFIFFCFYWYAVAVFCAVYYNSRSAFIKDSFVSFLLGLLYPLILYMFPSAFRLCALKFKNHACLYKLSDIIPIF